jgi:hypothetical protein
MNDLIDRTDLLRQIKKDSEDRRGSYGDQWEFIGTICRMPAVDAVSVRCKDCKYWDGTDYCAEIDEVMWEYDYCSIGEKKDG